MIRFVERLNDVCGKLSAAMFFAIGGMIVYEVIARYVFLSPTVWAEEMSRFFQIWATYLAAGYILKHRHLIRIELLIGRLGPRLRVGFEALSLVFIGVFCFVAIFYGAGVVAESVAVGRATSTMLAVPRWMTESAIPVGFGLLLVQCVIELLRLWNGEVPPPEQEGGAL